MPSSKCPEDAQEEQLEEERRHEEVQVLLRAELVLGQGKNGDGVVRHYISMNS